MLIKFTSWLVLPALLVTTACSERQEEQTAMQPVNKRRKRKSR